VYPYLPSSLDCPFSLPLRYSLTFICAVPCVLCVASFSGLFLFNCPFRYSLTFVCPVSCVPYFASFSWLSFVIAPSVLSNMYLCCTLCTLCCQFLLIVLFYCPLWYSLTFICDNVFSNVFVTYGYGLDNNVKPQK
jgi:hypothetical protein